MKLVLASLSVVALVACGGSGSSSSSNSTTPPPAVNQAPVILIDAPDFIFEKGVMRFDATKTYDPDDDALGEILIEQISGTPATYLYAVGRENEGFEIWTAPEFDGLASESLSFKITASDFQGLSSSREFNILVEADDLPGQPVGRYEGKLDLVVANAGNIGPDRPPNQVMAQRHDTIGQSELIWVGSDYTPFTRDISLMEVSQPIANATFEEIDYIQYDSLNFNLQVGPGKEFTVLEADNNRIRWFYSDFDTDEDGNDIYIESTQMDLESPCFIRRRVATGEDFIWVAHKSGGVSLVRINRIPSDDGVARDFTYETILKTSEDRRLCHIHPTQIDETIIPLEKNGQYQLYRPALAIDFDKNELVVLGDPRDGGVRYGEITSIPMQTETSETLHVVDVISRGEPNTLPRFMLVLLSDGQMDGIHRLVYVKQDLYGAISQETFSYEGPPPIGLHLGPMGGDKTGGQYALDIAITTSGSMGVFLDTTGGGISVPPSYADPVTFQMEPGGVNSVSVDYDEDSIDHEILVNYPDTKTLRVYNIE